MTTFIIIIIFLIILFLVRGMGRNHAEKTGLNICPKCGQPMTMKASSRYYCSHCGHNNTLYY